MKWLVYILRCRDGSYYTGITSDFPRRIKEHNHSNTRGAKYTRTRRPVSLVYRESFKTRSAAQRREFKVKRLSHSEKDRLCSTL